jgi:hypothetical protein
MVQAVWVRSKTLSQHNQSKKDWWSGSSDKALVTSVRPWVQTPVLQKIKTKTNKKITDKTSGTVQQASLPERSLSLYFSDKTKTHHWPRGLLSANSIAPMSTVLQCQSMQRKRTYRLASSRIQEGVNLLVLHPHELTLSPLLFSVCFK